MGVTLTDIDSGKDLHDVVVPFTKALLEKGYRADWLGIVPSMGPSSGTSAMPVLPIGDDDGVAYVELRPGKLGKAKKSLQNDKGDDMW
jgi:hypothetical protein